MLSTPVGAAVLRPNDVSPKLIRRGPFAQRSSRAGGPSVGAQYLRDGDVVALEFTGLAGGGGRLRLGAIRVGRRLRPRKRLRGSRIRRTPRAAPDAWPHARLLRTGADWYLACRLGGPLPIPVPRMCALRGADPGQRTLFGTTGEAEPEICVRPDLEPRMCAAGRDGRRRGSVYDDWL